MQVYFKVSAGGETNIFGTYLTLERACDAVVGYLNDEQNENPNCSTPRELYGALGVVCTGFLGGGNFGVTFQGELLLVDVVYDSLAELLGVFAEAEIFAAKQDDEGPSNEDVEEYTQKTRSVLPKYGDENGKWHMTVDPASTDLIESWHGPYVLDDAVAVYHGRVSWVACQGVVTVWQA